MSPFKRPRTRLALASALSCLCFLGAKSASAQTIVALEQSTEEQLKPFLANYPCVYYDDNIIETGLLDEDSLKRSISATYAALLDAPAWPLKKHGSCAASDPPRFAVDLARGYVWEINRDASGRHQLAARQVLGGASTLDLVTLADFLSYALPEAHKLPACGTVCRNFHTLLLGGSYPKLLENLRILASDGEDSFLRDAVEAYRIGQATASFEANSFLGRHCDPSSILRHTASRWMFDCVDPSSHQRVTSIELDRTISPIELSSSCKNVKWSLQTRGANLDAFGAIYYDTYPDKLDFTSSNCSQLSGGGYVVKRKAQLGPDSFLLQEGAPDPKAAACLPFPMIENLVTVELESQFVRGRLASATLSAFDPYLFKVSLEMLASPAVTKCTRVRDPVDGNSRRIECVPAAGTSSLASDDFALKGVRVRVPIGACPGP